MLDFNSMHVTSVRGLTWHLAFALPGLLFAMLLFVSSLEESWNPKYLVLSEHRVVDASEAALIRSQNPGVNIHLVRFGPRPLEMLKFTVPGFLTLLHSIVRRNAVTLAFGYVLLFLGAIFMPVF